MNHKEMNHKKTDHREMGSHSNPYARLLLMSALSFLSMYVFMYAMVNSFANALSSLNQFYMAGLMTAPMVIIELSLMSAMYMDKQRNALILTGSVIAVIGLFILIRHQAAISDRQFLRSMIPHHASAILMCEQSPAQNPAIKRLCKNIIVSQQAEIEQMKALLRDLGK